MKTTLLVITFFLCISMKAFSQTQSTGNGTLTINAENFSSDEGNAIAKLFRKEDNLPTKAFLETSVKIKDRKAVLAFTDIPYGDYAVIVCHDQNSNCKVDHNFLGFPAEPLGFSNGWELTLFSGLPSFSKLKFEFSKYKQDYKIDFK